VERRTLIGILVFIIVVIGVNIGIWYWYMQQQMVTAVAKETIVIGTTDRLVTLDPANAYDYLSCNVIENVFEGLYRYKPGTTELEPALAEDFPIITDNGYTWYIKIREGVKFHDGSELNATVVSWSLNRSMELGGDPAFLLTDIINYTRAINETTLMIRLKVNTSILLSILAFTVSYPVSMESFPADKFSDVAIGCGPFKVVEWVKDVHIILERFDDYWDQSHFPKMKRVIIKFYKTSEDLAAALRAGEIDIAYRTLHPEDVEAFMKDPNFRVLTSPSPFIRYLVLRCNMSPFDNVYVRQAIAAAINRTEICEKIFLGQAEPLFSMVPKGMWSHIDAFKELYGEEGNITYAQELLRKAGYSETNKLNITLWYTPEHYGPTEAELAALIKEQLERTGMINVKLEFAEWSTYVDNMEKGVMEIFLLGWYPDYLDPDDYLWPFVGTWEAACSLGTFYKSNESTMKIDGKTLYDYLLMARLTTDMSKRTDYYIKAQKIYAYDCPTIPLFQGVQICVTKLNVYGVVLDATQIFRYWMIFKT